MTSRDVTTQDHVIRTIVLTIEAPTTDQLLEFEQFQNLSAPFAMKWKNEYMCIRSMKSTN